MPKTSDEFIKQIEKKLALTQDECKKFLRLRVNYLARCVEGMAMHQGRQPLNTKLIQDLETEYKELMSNASSNVFKAMELYLFQQLKDLGYDTSRLPTP